MSAEILQQLAHMEGSLNATAAALQAQTAQVAAAAAAVAATRALHNETAATEAAEARAQAKRVAEAAAAKERMEKQGGTEPAAPLEPAAFHHIGQSGSACESKGGKGLKLAVSEKLVAPIVVVGHNRPHYVVKCMMALLRYWHEDPANAEKFPLFISIDGHHTPTLLFATALEYAAGVQVIQNLRHPGLCRGEGYCNLSQHYKMLLQLFFQCHKVPRLIILEEDLAIAPDFFSYFEAGSKLLAQDRSLWCISAWNDHGQPGRAANATALYRTDIMPGLGWMLQADAANELWPKWPNAMWDDWMRQPHIRTGRQCVFPEVSRTHTFGKEGTSGGMFYDEHLGPMILNQERINWTAQDWAFLQNATYAGIMQSWLAAAAPAPRPPELSAYCAPNITQDSQQAGDIYITYANEQQAVEVARALRPMMADPRFGAPRAAYHGIVVVRCRGRRLFIRPEGMKVERLAA